SLGIRAIIDIDVVPLEGLHERLGHTVGLRTAHQSEAGNQPHSNGKLDRLVGSVGAAVVREPLDRLRRVRGVKALLDGFQHQIRTISALMPPVVALQAMTSRSQLSGAKTTRTT